MTPKLTDAERANIAQIVTTVMDAMLPSLIKVVAAARPDTDVHAAGNLLVVEPSESNIRKEHRQALWCKTFLQNDELGAENGAACADAALVEFDKRFPS